MQKWLFLILAISFEVVGTTAMKVSYGFSKVLPTILTFIFYTASFFFLALTLKTIEVGTTYAIWSGAGTALIAVIGIIYFDEQISLLKIVSILLIITGVVGLNLARNYAS